MTKNLPDYTALEPPDGTPPTEYSTHERRAELCNLVFAAGSPHALNQSDLAQRYGVNQSTISRDLDRIHESVDEALGKDAKLTTRAMFERLRRDALDADDWRATKAAFDAIMDFNRWLADLGEQHHEPQRSELDVEMTAGDDAAYEVVRPGEGDLPTTDDGTIDYEALRFTSSPAEIEVATPDDESATDE